MFVPSGWAPMTAASDSPFLFPNPSLPSFSPQAAQDTEILRQLGFLPGLKELLTVRQVHALEHATVWMLEEMAQTPQARRRVENVSGMSGDRGFHLYGPVDIAELRQAVLRAQQRLIRGDWHLAVHPRCGTNLSVGMLMTFGLAAGINLFLPKDPIGQLLGFGMAAIAASSLAPDAGKLAQQYVTTAIPFNLVVDEIVAESDRWGQPVHFVRVRWMDVERVF